MAIETIWTGAHWSSPVTPGTSEATAGNMEAIGAWGTVILLSTQRNGTADGSFLDASDKADAVSRKLGNTGNLDQTIVRLYHDDRANGPITYDQVYSLETADNWLDRFGVYKSLDPYVAKGGRMIIFRNEFDLEGHMDPRTVACFAYALNNAFYNGGDRKLYTLFPGPSGMIDLGRFLNYFQRYDGLDGNGTNPQTFGERYGSDVDHRIAGKKMLWHGGEGVFDRMALHCYGPNPDQFGSEDVEANIALESIFWADQIIDLTSWKYITESGGQSDSPGPDHGDSYTAGKAAARFERAVDRNNQVFWGGRVRAVYKYILDPSNTGATSNGRHIIGPNYIRGYNEGI